MCYAESGTIGFVDDWIFPMSTGTVAVCALSFHVDPITGIGDSINNIEAGYYDSDSTQNITVAFRRRAIASDFSEDVCSTSSTGTSTLWRALSYTWTEPTCAVDPVDLENYVYYVEVSFGATIWCTSGTSCAHRLANVGAGTAP